MTRNQVSALAATAYVLAAGTVLGAYEVQGRQMPEWLFDAIRIVGGVIIVSSATVWACTALLIPAAHWLGAHEYRWPMRRKGKLTPREAFVAQVEERERGNPAARIVIVDQSIDIRELGNVDSPRVTFTFWIFNGSAYEITWQDSIRGKVRLGGNELGSHKPELVGGGETWMPGATYRLRVKQPLLNETATKWNEMVLKGNWKLNGSVVDDFSLVDVGLAIKANYNGSPVFPYALRREQPGGDATKQFITATER